MDPENIYFVGYYEKVGDGYRNLGHILSVGKIPEGRVLGAPGIQEHLLKKNLTLDKSYGINVVEASVKRPRKVWSMVTLFDPIALPFWVHPQTRPEDLELELKKVGVRFCRANGFEECTLENLFGSEEYKALTCQVIQTLRGRGEELDKAISRLLEKLS